MYRTKYVEEWIQKPIFIYIGNSGKRFCFGGGTYRVGIVTTCHATTELLIIQLYELSVLMWDVCKIAQVHAEYDLIPFIRMTDEIINMQVHTKHVLELRPGIHYVEQDGV
jgi:hypothetical protein